MTTTLPLFSRTWAPVCGGMRPPSAIMRPAFTSRSAMACMACMSSGVGGPSPSPYRRNMKRMGWNLL